MFRADRRPPAAYVVTNSSGQWLADSSGTASIKDMVWVDHISHAFVFLHRENARLAAFHHGGYIVELKRYR